MHNGGVISVFPSTCLSVLSIHMFQLWN